jgi:hypothetical protein
MKTLDVSQATAAAQAGGVLCAILRAEGGAFHVELETRMAGVAVLVTSNHRRPRAFRNPARALEVIRELGLQTGRFSLEAWRPDKVEFERQSRPDRAEAMKATHASAAAYDKWVRQQVQEAIDDPRPAIAHEDVMKKAGARIEAMRKGKREGLSGRSRQKTTSSTPSTTSATTIPMRPLSWCRRSTTRLTACASARRCIVPAGCAVRAR